MKIALKIGLLYRHKQFSAEEMALGNSVRKKFKSTVLTMLSFHDVDFTFDKDWLSKAFTELKDMIQQQIRKHLSKNSEQRAQGVAGRPRQEEG